jgi:hypothetical protein
MIEVPPILYFVNAFLSAVISVILLYPCYLLFCSIQLHNSIFYDIIFYFIPLFMVIYRSLYQRTDLHCLVLCRIQPSYCTYQLYTFHESFFLKFFISLLSYHLSYYTFFLLSFIYSPLFSSSVPTLMRLIHISW